MERLQVPGRRHHYRDLCKIGHDLDAADRRQLIFSGREDINLHQLSPWLDFRTGQREQVEILDAQEHRRFIKTHLPADALVISPQARYIYVARDGRDTAWSIHNHHLNFTEETIKYFNDAPDGLARGSNAVPRTSRNSTGHGSPLTATLGGPSGTMSGPGGRYVIFQTSC